MTVVTRAGTFSILTILFLGMIELVPAQVTVEIVNDTGKPDGSIFLKVPGRLWDGITNTPMIPTNLFVDIADANASAAAAASLPLSTLATNYSAAPYDMVSPITGRTNRVYSFQADYLRSGSIYFTYDQSFSFIKGLQPSAPPDSAGNAYRYDYAELSVKDTDAGNNAVDGTCVDKFGIPLQLEWFSGSRLVAGSYVYLSTRTLAQRFAEAGLGQAVFSLNATNIAAGWQYTGTNSYTNFARILAPQKVSGAGHSVAPYPNITNYLNSLTGSGQAFWLNGAAPHKGYIYLGYVASVHADPDGWQVTLAKSPKTPDYNPAYLAGTNYTNTITFPISHTNASQYVYGSPVGPNRYAVNGTPVTDSTSATYEVEVWMIGDALSALNFGFWGGRYGTNSVDWFSTMQWTAFPFGSARNTADGCYNAYAALIYNYADPYSYAFSERITPDVLMAPANNDRVRITILADDRLDSPTVPTPETNAITADSITLNWTPVSGAGGYQVNVLRPLGVPPVALPSSITSYTLTNLQPGTPYVLSVQATGTGAFGNPIITPARPVYATTPGSRTPSVGNLTQVQVTFSASDPFYQLAKVYINGTELLRNTNNQWQTTGGVPARWIAAEGTNQVTVTVVGTNNQVLFNDWLTFVLAPPFAVGAETHSAISNIFLYGQKLSQPPPNATGFLNGTNPLDFRVSTLNPSLSIGLSYVPADTRRFAPLGTTQTGMTIRNVAPLAGGGIQFSFNVPQGTAYALEASPNLTVWHTNATGTGQANTVTYSNTAGTNLMQYYRIKY
jgi:hypothetical protein